MGSHWHHARSHKEVSPMGSHEARSSELWLTAIQAPWVASRWRPVDYEVSQHLALDRTTRYKIQLKLSQLHYPFSDIVNRIRVVEYIPQWV
jgi:hypothetical protein